MSVESIELKVAEALQNDVSRGIVRIDSDSAKQINVTTGDIVEITGKRSTTGKVWQCRAEDEGKSIIRMDGLIRQNSSSSLGDKIKIRKADVSDAKKLVIAPSTHEISFSDNNFSEYVKHRVLLGKPVITADIFYMPGLGGQNISFTVVNTKPAGVVRITEDTQIEVKTKPTKVGKSTASIVRYEDIGGLKDEVSRVREMIELPMKHPELFEKIGIKPPKGVLLYGPPGTGKTLLAKAVASESNATFMHLNGPEIMDKYYGESERKLREIFEEAQANSPAIIFIDEIDSIASKRDDTKGEVERRVVAQLLALMDGLLTRGDVIVVAATNRPDSLDPALRRPGRFDREIEIGVPDRFGRYEILQIHTRGMPLYHFTPSIATDELIEKINNFEENTQKKILMLKPNNNNNSGNDNNTLNNNDIQNLIEKYKRQIKSVNIVKSRIENNNEYKGALTQTFTELVSIKEKTKGTIQLDDVIAALTSSTVLKSEKNGVRHSEILRESGIVDEDYITQVIRKSSDILIKEKSSITHGFVGADLQAIAREAAMHALKRILPKIDLESEVIPTEVLENLSVIKEDFNEALKVVEPSALREVYVEVPNVRWKQIGGLKEVKVELIEAVEWPLNRPEAFERMGIQPPKAMLLYGPPGCGKTLLAKAIATESEANFISIKGPELLSKWVGESEKAIREIFKKARQTAPTIIFFDEIDSIAPMRGVHQGSHVTETVVNQILTELDGIERLENVMIIGATNRPDIMDPSLLRPGRFDRLVLVPLPDKEARHEIVKVHTKEMPLKGIKTEEIAEKTEGYTGADIEALMRESAMNALREDANAQTVQKRHLEEALTKVKPSVTEVEAKSYDKRIKKQKDEKTPAYN